MAAFSSLSSDFFGWPCFIFPRVDRLSTFFPLVCSMTAPPTPDRKVGPLSPLWLLYIRDRLPAHLDMVHTHTHTPILIHGAPSKHKTAACPSCCFHETGSGRERTIGRGSRRRRWWRWRRQWHRLRPIDERPQQLPPGYCCSCEPQGGAPPSRQHWEVRVGGSGFGCGKRVTCVVFVVLRRMVGCLAVD